MENQATKDIHLKISSAVIPMEKRGPTVVAQAFKSKIAWNSNEDENEPLYSKWNTKILPNDEKARAYWSYVSAINYVYEKHEKNCVGVFLYLQSDDAYLKECETATKLPYIANKEAWKYRYYAIKLAKESGLTVSWNFTGTPETPESIKPKEEIKEKHGDTLEETEAFCHMVDNMKLEETPERELTKEEQNTLDTVFEGIDKNTKNKV